MQEVLVLVAVGLAALHAHWLLAASHIVVVPPSAHRPSTPESSYVTTVLGSTVDLHPNSSTLSTLKSDQVNFIKIAAGGYNVANK